MHRARPRGEVNFELKTYTAVQRTPAFSLQNSRSGLAHSGDTQLGCFQETSAVLVPRAISYTPSSISDTPRMHRADAYIGFAKTKKVS